MYCRSHWLVPPRARTGDGCRVGGAVTSPFQIRGSHLVWVLAALFFVPMFLPFVQLLLAPGHKPEPSLGDIEASAVYPDNQGALHMLRVMRLQVGAQDVFQILHNDLQAKQLEGEPQRITMAHAAGRQPAQMRMASDGQIDMLLGGQQWWRWNPPLQRWDAMNAPLAQQFAQQLGQGIAQITFGAERDVDQLDITNSTGERYAVYWATQEIYRFGDIPQRLRERPWARYAKTTARIDYAEFRTDVARYGRPMTLLHYQQKVRDGEFQRLPLLVVRSDSDGVVRATPKRYQAIGEGFVMERSSLLDAGVVQAAQVAGVPVQYSAQVLARNADRVLMRFEETPDSPTDGMLQMLDTHSLQVVWRQSMRDMPQVLDDGRGLAAQAWAGGFYLTTAQHLPALVIANDGAVLHDFRPQAHVAVQEE